MYGKLVKDEQDLHTENKAFGLPKNATEVLYVISSLTRIVTLIQTRWYRHDYTDH